MRPWRVVVAAVAAGCAGMAGGPVSAAPSPPAPIHRGATAGGQRPQLPLVSRAQGGGFSSCSANTAEGLRDPGPGTQLVTVTAARHDTTLATLTAWQRRDGCWVKVLGPYAARIGASGLHDVRHEGDGSTPTGLYAVGSTLYGLEPATPNPRYPYHHLVCGDWWDEDPSSAHYNTFQHVPCGEQPWWGPESEALWTEAPAYEDFAVIEFNTPPRGPLGSGIFLHDNIGTPTQGCVSLPPDELDAVLAWMRPGDRPWIAIGTTAEISRF